MTSTASSPSMELNAQVAQLLSDWWTRPDPARIALWASPGYQEQVRQLWQEAVPGSAESLGKLLSAVVAEPNALTAEYERLFVGPAAIPCPPYEAVWRSDRPKHEQGTVMGGSTMRVRQIYSELGVRPRAGEVELPDHIAMELEALAHAWWTNHVAQAEALVLLFQGWLPAFAASVVTNSRIDFYRRLAEVTWEFFLSLGPADVSDQSDGSRVREAGAVAEFL